MKITILTLFPEMFAPLQHSIVKRATDAGHLTVELVNFRDYTDDKHKRVDDYSYSGGAGMVLRAQPIVDCIEAIDPKRQAHRILMTPAAPVLTQARVTELATKPHVIILCGHYEGVDQRAIDLCIDEVVSIGDYVLTGGELPAMVLADAVARHVPGVLNAASLNTESHNPDNRLLEHPHYTRPQEYRGLTVPAVLTSGNHAKIEEWKRAESLAVTRRLRADLLG